MELLNAIEQSGFSTWVRESSSIFAYPMILFLHTVGLAFLVGPSVAIVARVLGVAPKLPVAPLEKFYPIMWTGFWINAASGTVLLIADAATKLLNWDFYVKLVFIAAAVLLLKRLRRQLFHSLAGGGDAKWIGIALLCCWTGAITAGRLMAYLGPMSDAPALNKRF